MGLKIRIARIKKNMTIKELAQKLGVSYQYISEIERGKRKSFSINLLIKISKELDLDTNELLDSFIKECE